MENIIPFKIQEKSRHIKYDDPISESANLDYHSLLYMTRNVCLEWLFFLNNLYQGEKEIMKMEVLGVSSYEKAGQQNYGDCIIVDNGNELLIYDCGSEEHAKVVETYMEKNGYENAIFVLSHNDDDHFKGLNYLLEQGKISEIWTTLLLKYKQDILDAIGDGRKNKNALTDQILELFDNIASLSGENLKDVYEDGGIGFEIIDGVSIAGPDKEYMIERVAAKALDTTEGDQIDKESITNAMSVQLEVKISEHKVLLTGDSSYEGIKNNLANHDVIQLPHHGKQEQADKIFEEKDSETDTIYLVSDNTGNSNGGSDNMMKNSAKSHIVWNTKEKGTLKISDINLKHTIAGTGRKLGGWSESFIAGFGRN